MLFMATGIATEDMPEFDIVAGAIVIACSDINLHNLAESMRGMAEMLWVRYGTLFISWGPVPAEFEPLLVDDFDVVKVSGRVH